MTAVKLVNKLATHASQALEPHVPGMYGNLGKRIVGIVEIASVERSQAAPDEDKEASVTLQIKHMEVAGVEQEDTVRQALRALHTQRTAYGTLNEADEIALSETTLRACAGQINAIEAARLHIAVEKWGEYASAILHNGKLTASDLRQELRTLADGLRATIHPDTLVKG